MAKISIIVPVYNTEHYLRKCLESIMNQTFTDFEVIIVNDGSPDNSWQIAQEFRDLDSRFIYVEQINEGLSSARNTGILYASSDFLCFIDSDDWVHPNYLKILYESIITTNSDISICNFIRTDDRDFSLDSFKEYNVELLNKKEAFYALYSRKSVEMTVSWNKLYKKSLFSSVLYDVGKFHEDEYIIHSILDQVEKVSYVDCPLYYYYFNVSGIMNSKFSPKRLDIIEALENRINYILKEFSDERELLFLSQYSLLRVLVKNYYLCKVNKYDESEKELQNKISEFKTLYAFNKLSSVSKVKIGLICTFPYVAGKLLKMKEDMT